jgi:hypothetical protein
MKELFVIRYFNKRNKLITSEFVENYITATANMKASFEIESTLYRATISKVAVLKELVETLLYE